MKKLVISSLTILALMFSSCSDDDDSSSNNSLIGKWQKTSDIFDGKEEIDECEKLETLEFSEDTLKFVDFDTIIDSEGMVDCEPFDEETRNYSVSGETITIIDSEDDSENKVTFEVSGDTLVITFMSVDDDKEVTTNTTYKRI